MPLHKIVLNRLFKSAKLGDFWNKNFNCVLEKFKVQGVRLWK